MSINILLADDHKIVRDGLRSLLEKQGGMKVVAEAANGREAVRLALQVKPDIVIMDIAMPDLNGIEAIEQIAAQAPEVKILALSMHSDKRFISRALSAGALGYMLKDCAFDEMINAIQTIASDKAYLSAQVTDTVIGDYVNHLKKNNSSPANVLTTRETEVLQLLAEGKSTKETASLLRVSIKTIETYRSQIMEKLDLHSVAELTKFAVREGITFLEP